MALTAGWCGHRKVHHLGCITQTRAQLPQMWQDKAVNIVKDTVHSNNGFFQLVCQKAPLQPQGKLREAEDKLLSSHCQIPKRGPSLASVCTATVPALVY